MLVDAWPAVGMASPAKTTSAADIQAEALKVLLGLILFPKGLGLRYAEGF
jgi:hypothetical protein